MAETFANHNGTTLAGAISSTTRPATFTVTSAANLPSSGNFRVLIENEIFLVTSISGTSLTGSNAEGTTAATHASGAAVTHILTAGALAQLETDMVASAMSWAGDVSANGHNLSGAGIVNTAGVQVTSFLAFSGSMFYQPGAATYFTSANAGSGAWNEFAYAVQAGGSLAADEFWVSVNARTTLGGADSYAPALKIKALTGAVTFPNTVTFTVAPVFTDASGTRSALGLAASATTDATNATNISTGTLADGRLSSNVPLKNAANTFTGASGYQQTYNASIGGGSGAALLYTNPTFSNTGSAYLFLNSPTLSGTGITNFFNINTKVTLAASATVTGVYGLILSSPTINSGATIGTIYGLYVGDQAATGITTAYGIYQHGVSDSNYFGGPTAFNSNVGIGTTAPATLLAVNGRAIIGGNTDNSSAYALQVEGTSNTSAYVVTTASTGSAAWVANNDSTAFVQFKSYGSAASGTLFGFSIANFTAMFGGGAAATGLGIGTTGAVPLIFGTNNAEAMRILSGGNVGIGTTNPPNRLAVQTSAAKATSATTNCASFTSNDAAGTADLGVIVRVGGSSVAANRWSGLLSYEYGTGSRPLVLQDLGGSVLVGTTTDNGTDKLQVNGTLNAASTVKTIELRVTATGTNSQCFTIFNSANARWALGTNNAESSGNAGSDFVLFSYNDAGAYLGNPLVLKRSNGNLLLGTNTDNTRDKLQVNGSANVSGLVYVGAPASAPIDGNLGAAQISFYLDEAGNNLKVRVKYSNGTTLKTATVALT